MSRPVRLSAVLLAASLTLVGCGSEDAPDSTSTPTPSESPTAETTSPAVSPSPSKKPPSGTTIEITVRDGEVRPDGVRKKVKAGKPVRLRIVSDTAGELHVHSSPEQEIAYEVGTTTKSITIERPGVVDVEDHELHKLIVQLEVR